MDECIMHTWVQMVLKPCFEQAPPGVQPSIFLDLYECHMMACVMNNIQDLIAVQYKTIRRGSTRLSQPPIDIGMVNLR